MIFISVESNFLSKLLETGDFETVDTLQIRSRFLNGRYKKAFKWIQEHVAKYGKVPSVKEFKRKFANVTLEDADGLEEPMSFYCEELRSKVMHNALVDMFEEGAELLNEHLTKETISLVTKVLLNINKEYVKRETRYLNGSAEEWKKDYEDAEKGGGITGIRIGIDPFDFTTGGVGKTDLVTFLGYTGVGKTWLLIIIACYLTLHGYKVLFGTREMSTKQIMKRAFAVLNKLPYGKLKSGKLNPKQKQKYFAFLEKMEKQEESNLVVELITGGVSTISALVDLHQPDVLLIDGGYLMTDDSDDKEWKGLVETWWGFKQIALNRGIPVFTTMQLKNGKASLDNVAMAKYISQYCDIMYGMEQDEQMQNDREMKMKPLKLRDADMAGSFVIRWDFTKMDWSPIYGENVNIEKQEDEPEEEIDTADIPRKKIQKI